ncbi:YfiR/HmsC family protein [Cellvibrio sp. ARAG 10.3]|uniref:YfiR/HmsC family protein n=1 Tax=Cellvibrio sp. ARAG 10.3 TaxID=3451358 RepID=UPI003F46B9EF
MKQQPIHTIIRVTPEIKKPSRPWCWLALLLLCCFSSASQAQALNKHKITASYLYNFAKNIEWPDEKSMASFNIGFYGSDNPQLLNEIRTMAASVKLRNLPITVTQATTVNSLSRFHLVYVEQANNNMVSDIYDALGGQPVLLVTAEYPNKQLVMINLITDNDRLRFEVNRSNIINHGLQPLPELILNGGTEIDVARLYREGQASLVALQRQLQNREKTLNELSTAIDAQEAKNQRLETQLATLNQSIQKSDALIADQNLLIQNQLDQIEQSKQERLRLLEEVEQRTQELDKQQQQLDAIVQQIDRREKRLAELNTTIKSQEDEILTQRQAIAGLDEKVDAQKTALTYLWGLVSLGVLLIITILIGYTIKRRDNQRLAEHSKDLQIAKDRLAIAKRKAEDASQAKSEFLSLMSHELRTPLQAIIGYTEVVIEELKLADDENHINDLTRVISNSERLLKLINGVLDLAKIESGRMELDLTEVKLSSLVDEAVSVVAPLLEKNAIQLNIDVDDGSFLPMADPEKILHILINLLGNASKFSPKGTVTIKALHQPNRIYISVADTGIGLSAEQQQQIFEPFRQADSGTTRKFQGSGLGLSITRQLCEMMGGSIEVESELGRGATFIVDLPLPIELPPAFGGPGVDANADVAIHDSDIASNGQHIVMIDDDPAFLDIMARTMQSEGFLVHTAHDAETGLRLLQTIKPDVITLDLLLPDQHGWMLFESIKADADLQDIPVIIISIMDERKQVHKHQAEDYLTKPIRRETLKLAIQRLVPKT